MSLYKQWTEMVVEYVKTKGEKAFWAEYTKVETAIYRDLLANHKEAIKITIADFAKKYETFAKDSKTTVNAATLYPYDVVSKAVDRDGYYCFNNHLPN